MDPVAALQLGGLEQDGAHQAHLVLPQLAGQPEDTEHQDAHHQVIARDDPVIFIF